MAPDLVSFPCADLAGFGVRVSYNLLAIRFACRSSLKGERNRVRISSDGNGRPEDRCGSLCSSARVLWNGDGPRLGLHEPRLGAASFLHDHGCLRSDLRDTPGARPSFAGPGRWSAGGSGQPVRYRLSAGTGDTNALAVPGPGGAARLSSRYRTVPPVEVRAKLVLVLRGGAVSTGPPWVFRGNAPLSRPSSHEVDLPGWDWPARLWLAFWILTGLLT